MDYSIELHFLRESLGACRLQTLIISPNGSIDPRMDLGLRTLIGWEPDYVHTLTAPFRTLAHNVVYRMTDQFQCHYLFFLLPDQSPDALLWIGPYFPREITHGHLAAEAEQYDLPPHRVKQLEYLLGQLPILPEDSPIFPILNTFCQRIWGGSEHFSLTDITKELSGRFTPLPEKHGESTPEDIAWNMTAMEQRYAFENELLQAVSQGLSHKGQVLLSRFSGLSFEQRTPDNLRNLKNYCIIMNTLLRKAAEHGGVHPLYLDRNSAAFARRIEQLTSAAAVRDMMSDMFYSYCRLVNRHSTQQYSLPVRRVITQIDSDLTADLGLKALAASQNISPGYLSTLFKKETGVTVTEYVTQRRIRHAIRLLNSTQLQIQTVARHCGIPDVNYFSKVFKKQTGKTPKDYRKSLKVEKQKTS